jgi:hypothetical protein
VRDRLPLRPAASKLWLLRPATSLRSSSRIFFPCTRRKPRPSRSWGRSKLSGGLVPLGQPDSDALAR